MNKKPTAAQDHFFAIIPAGGVGSRLWPLSRASAPKFLHDLTGSGQTLLQDTWDRLSPLVGNRMMVVTGDVHAATVNKHLPDLDQANLILEPSPKDSTAAIALAAAVLYKRDPKVIVGSFAADHVIRNNGKLLKAIEASIEIAATGKIVTIGIVPTEASVAFGYIKKGSPISGTEGFEVADFIEKPNIKKAGKFVASKKYLWNAGMFIAPAKLLLDVLAKTQPKLHAGVMELAEHWDTENRTEKLHSIWPGLDKIAIDYAIAEPAAKLGLVAVVPGNFEWHDVGDFAAIAELQSQGNSNNLAVLGSAKVLSDSSSGILVSDTNRLVALIGLEDIIVVDTADALLITTKVHAQKVKAMVEALKQTGHSDLL